MAAASSFSVVLSAFSLPSSSLQRRKLIHGRSSWRSSTLLVSACNEGANYDRGFGGRLVDENMVVLRKRIHEMKMAAAEEDYEAPLEWAEWERRYHARYGSDVSELVGMVQGLLLSSRPCVGLAWVAVVSLSAPTLVLVIVFHLVQLVAKFVVVAAAGGGGGA